MIQDRDPHDECDCESCRTIEREQRRAYTSALYPGFRATIAGDQLHGVWDRTRTCDVGTRDSPPSDE